MKISQLYLNKWVSNLPKIDDLSEQLTEQGLEVDEIIPVCDNLKNIEIGHVIDINPHPDADKLRVCTVLVSDDQKLNIVCGAKNVDKDQKVPVARIGAVLPGNFKIKKSKLRGVLSEGMICSESELGLADSAPGIMVLPNDAPVGEDVIKYLNLDDNIIDIELTANRGDCANYIGTAREIAVINKKDYKLPEYLESFINQGKKYFNNKQKNNLESQVCHHGNKDICSAYSLYKIDLGVGSENKNLPKASIDLSEFLRRSGVSSVNVIVDIINSAMLNLGQPMHAFDSDELNGNISIRMAKKGEKLTALNDQTYDLNTDTLIIADESGPLAIAGVIGAKRCSVNDSTKNILLESAYFDKVNIAKTARFYGLQTDSSYRFERGVDPAQVENAVLAVIGNLCEYFPDLSVISKYEGGLDNIIKTKNINFDLSKALDYLGINNIKDLNILSSDIKKGFEVLGFAIKTKSENNWVISVPSWRHDVSVYVDLVEELARVIGYNKIPSTLPKVDFALDILHKSKQLQEAKNYYSHSFLSSAYSCLLGRGYNEALNYSFISKKQIELFDFDDNFILEISNPISQELAVMAPSLLPGLIKNCQYNIKRQQSSVRLFEQGRCFIKHRQDNKTQNKTNTPANESEIFSGLIYGEAMHLNSHNMRKLDFYDIKSDVMALLSAYKDGLSFDVENLPVYLHPGQSMGILYKNNLIGYCGAIHPKIAQKLGLSSSVYVFEINFMLLPNFNLDPNNMINNISKYPQVSRDIAFVINSDIHFSDVISEINSLKNKLLKNIECFDVFKDEDKLGKNKKSLALRLTLQDETQTLSEDVINSSMKNILSILEKKFAVILRD